MCPVCKIPAPFVLLLCVALSGCGGDVEQSGEAVVTDSAGVRMVENPDGAFDGGGTMWTVGTSPQVTIGEESGEDPYLFDRIMGIERLSDGRWVVADMGSSQIRWFDAEGRHLQSAGGRGEGPEEFRQVMGLTRLAGDTLLVDDARSRLQMLDEAGAFLGEFSATGSPVGERTDPVGAFRDGTVVAATASAYPQRLTSPQSIARTYHRAALEAGEGRGLELQVLDTIGSWEVLNLVPGWNEMAQRVEFEEWIHIALLGEGLVVADPMRFEVRILSADGELRTVSRFHWNPEPVTNAHIEQRREDFIHQEGEGGGPVAPQLIQQRTEITEAWEISDHLPAFSGVIVDEVDHIWLREYVPNEARVGSWTPAPLDSVRWLVLSPEGEVVAGAETPARFRPGVIGHDFVAGVHFDELEVARVHVYSLERDGP